MSNSRGEVLSLRFKGDVVLEIRRDLILEPFFQLQRGRLAVLCGVEHYAGRSDLLEICLTLEGTARKVRPDTSALTTNMVTPAHFFMLASSTSSDHQQDIQAEAGPHRNLPE